MTSSELERIRSWDARCGDNELTFFPVTIHRRRLLQYVDELRAEVALLSALQMRQERTWDAAVCRGSRSPIVARADAKIEDTEKRAMQAGA